MGDSFAPVIAISNGAAKIRRKCLQSEGCKVSRDLQSFCHRSFYANMIVIACFSYFWGSPPKMSNNPPVNSFSENSTSRNRKHSKFTDLTWKASFHLDLYIDKIEKFSTRFPAYIRMAGNIAIPGNHNAIRWVLFGDSCRLILMLLQPLGPSS